MMLRMYLRWCERRGFKTEVIDFQPGDEAGIDGASFTVNASTRTATCAPRWACTVLVRISPFDGNASPNCFAAVEVTPDIEDEIDIEIARR